ncbi:hypothetical protein NKH18_50135 [Streptomyces sp. M10(2022)]
MRGRSRYAWARTGCGPGCARPLLSGAAAAIFLLLGYGLRLAGTELRLAGALVDAGWIAAALAALTVLIAGVALVLTAARHGRRPAARTNAIAPPSPRRARHGGWRCWIAAYCPSCSSN